jgi:hypothetical protein
MLDGPYWVVNGGGEILGVAETREKADEALKDSFMEEFGLPGEDRLTLSTRIKFDQVRLVRFGIDVTGFYATNEKRL